MPAWSRLEATVPQTRHERSAVTINAIDHVVVDGEIHILCGPCANDRTLKSRGWALPVTSPFPTIEAPVLLGT
jgi:hypothetical protein